MNWTPGVPPDEIRRRSVDNLMERAEAAQSVAADLLAEIRRQDEIHPSGYPRTRDGIRLGIAAAEDELFETKEAWRLGKASGWWDNVRMEALQTAAVLIRLVRSIDAQEDEQVTPAPSRQVDPDTLVDPDDYGRDDFFEDREETERRAAENDWGQRG